MVDDAEAEPAVSRGAAEAIGADAVFRSADPQQRAHRCAVDRATMAWLETPAAADEMAPRRPIADIAITIVSQFDTRLQLSNRGMVRTAKNAAIATRCTAA